MHARRYSTSRIIPRRNRSVREGVERWTGTGTSVRAARAAESVRFDPRAGGTTHRVGVLSRTPCVESRYDRADRAAGRAIRTWFSGFDSRATDDVTGGY